MKTFTPYAPQIPAPPPQSIPITAPVACAAFALPLIRPGMRLLDCGCGSGATTLALAERVRPGGIIGIDIQIAGLEAAHSKAQERGLNAAFIEAHVDALPFGPAQFDGIFAHGLFEHLMHPTQVLRELRRVMKPGAFIALRSLDWGGFVMEPYDEGVATALDSCRHQFIQKNGDAHAGRKLGTWLRGAGFHHITPSASYEMHSANSPTMHAFLQTLEIAEDDTAATQLRQWMTRPGATLAQSWFEAVGWKPWI